MDIYLVDATPGVVNYCVDITGDILVAYDHNDKIVSVEIDGVSSLLNWPIIPRDGKITVSYELG